MNKDMYFKMMGLKKEAAQPVGQETNKNTPIQSQVAGNPAGTGSAPQAFNFADRMPSASKDPKAFVNFLNTKTDPVAPVKNTESFKNFQQGYNYAKSKMPQYDQKGSFWTNLLNKLYEFFGSKKRFGVLKQESLSKSASISSNMSRDNYDKMMSLYVRVHSS